MRLLLSAIQRQFLSTTKVSKFKIMAESKHQKSTNAVLTEPIQFSKDFLFRQVGASTYAMATVENYSIHSLFLLHSAVRSSIQYLHLLTSRHNGKRGRAYRPSRRSRGSGREDTEGVGTFVEICR